jgi:hypothetical protein
MFAIISIVVVAPGCGPMDSESPLEVAPSFEREPAAEWGSRPFHGRFEGQLTFIPPFQEGSLDACNANFSGDPVHPGRSVSAFDEAVGMFAVIGRFRLQSTFCFDPDSPDSEGTGVMIATNGEQIAIGFANTAGVPGEDGIVPVNGSQWITGGTGRFAGASGRQVCRLFVNALTLRIHGHCEGRIRSDPSRGRAASGRP